MLCVVRAHMWYRVILKLRQLFGLVIQDLYAIINYKPPVDVGLVHMCASFQELSVKILFESSLL
jgi:hypothetical protein